MTNYFKDYDALAAEKEPFAFRVGGKDITLPPELPAKLVLDARRKARGKMSDEDAEDFGFQLIERVIGEENWSHVLAHIGIGSLGELVKDVFAHYGLGGEQTESDPKAGETKKPSPLTTSSNTSEPSTPTSNVSTPTREGDSTTGPSAGAPSSPALVSFPTGHAS